VGIVGGDAVFRIGWDDDELPMVIIYVVVPAVVAGLVTVVAVEVIDDKCYVLTDTL
jgi:hypothetical protein